MTIAGVFLVVLELDCLSIFSLCFFLSGGDPTVFVKNLAIVPLRFAAFVFNCLIVLVRHFLFDFTSFHSCYAYIGFLLSNHRFPLWTSSENHCSVVDLAMTKRIFLKNKSSRVASESQMMMLSSTARWCYSFKLGKSRKTFFKSRSFLELGFWLLSLRWQRNSRCLSFIYFFVN